MIAMHDGIYFVGLVTLSVVHYFSNALWDTLGDYTVNTDVHHENMA